MSEVSIEQLVVRSQAGDRQAYAVLIERSSRGIYALCLGHLANVHDAEDVTQEVLVKGFTQIRQLRDSSKFEPWLRRMARNLSRDWLRKRSRCRETTLDSLEPEANIPEQDSRLGRLARAIQDLPVKYRRLIQLRYFEGKPSKEVAKQLNLSSVNVNTQLFRARKLLLETLSERGGAM